MQHQFFLLLAILMAFAVVTKSQYNRPSRPAGNIGGGGSYSGYRPSQGGSASSSTPKNKELELFYEWKELDFEFPSEQEKMRAIRQGHYVPGNGLPIDMAVHYKADGKCRVFVTVPRFVTGIPVTLATVSNYRGSSGPKLTPYPHYSVHASHGRDCDGITSVFRVAIDECERMWVVDTGRVGSTQYCPPQLLVFDLRTDILMHRYKFPESQFTPEISLFITPIVDVRDPPPKGRCMNTKVYIADVTGFGIIVYDSSENTSWKTQNKLMYPYPNYGTVTVAGESFELMDGIMGMDITPKNRRGPRYLYFHALASGVENAVPLSVLDNKTAWLNNSGAEPQAFKVIGDRHIQSAAEAMDSKGNLYFGLMEPVALAYWNIDTPYNTNSIKIISQNNKTLQFASGIKVVKNPQGREELWVSTCRFQKVAAQTKNSNEINYRIQRCFTDDLLSDRVQSCGAGTCNSPKQNSANPVGQNSDNIIFE